MVKVIAGLILLSPILFFNYAFADGVISKPKVPYYAWGQCIGEGCGVTNGHDVEINGEADVYSERNLQSKVKFQLNSGDKVTGISQHIVVRKLGIVKVINSFPAHVEIPDKKVGSIHKELKFKAGDTIYEIYPTSEGYSLFWYKGVLFCDNAENRPVKVISYSDFDEWQKVKNKKGQFGWAINLPYWGERA